MEPFSQSSDFTTPVNTTPPKKSKKGLLVLVITLLVLGLGGFWFYRGYRTNQEKAEKDIFLTPTAVVEEILPTENPEASPSPTAKVKGVATVTSAKDLRIEVLNGSGEEGTAGKMRDHLTAKGYQFIDVGNAENFDYQGVEVRIKEEYKKYLETVENDIKDAYNLSSDSGKIVTEASDVDVTVIVGK